MASKPVSFRLWGVVEPLCRASLHIFSVGREKGSWINLLHTQHLEYSPNPRSDCVGAPLVAPGTFSKNLFSCTDLSG